MSETLKQNFETTNDQEPTSFDALAENSEEKWRQMQEAREQAEQERLDARNERMGEEAIELDHHLNPDNSSEVRRTQEQARDAIEASIRGDFTTVEEIASLVSQGAEGSFMEMANYGDKQIPVYNTGNLDFRFLQHSIKFGSAERTTLTIDPSNWDKIDKETARKTGKSELISFFYRSSNNAPDENYIQSTVRYGMLSLPPHSLRVVSHGGIPIHGDAIGFSEWLDDEDLSDASDRIVDSDYELQAFRYGDDGKQAFRPDFIIASQDGVDEQALRQAEYFQVPVFVIPKHHVETKEDRVQPIKKQIEEYIQKSVKRNSERFPEEDSMEYEQTLRQLATSTNQEGWSRRQKAIHSELYSLVQQLESQE